MDHFNLFILKEFVAMIFGPHYPREIVTLIMMSDYQPIIVSCNELQTIIFKNETYVCGYNRDGSLGLGDIGHKYFPTKLNLKDHPRLICCGMEHMMIVTESKLYGWGCNYYGELGLGNFKPIYSPTELMLSNLEIESISCGLRHNVISLKSGKCYSWGENKWGQLGLGDTLNKWYPEEIQGLNSDICSVKCGLYHTTALTKYDQCYVWGNNEYGQLGLGHETNKYLPEKLNLFGIVSISCGSSHTVVLTENKMYVWGSNESGQLGLGDEANRKLPTELNLMTDGIKSVSCGKYHTMALTKNGKVYIWGSNWNGQLGLGDKLDYVTPHEIIFNNNIVKSINCGSMRNIIVTQTDKIYGWGRNEYGQLGLGDTGTRYVPTEIFLP